MARNIPTKQTLFVSIPTKTANIEVGDTLVQGLNLPRISLAKRLGADWTARLDYDFHFSTVGLGVSYRWLYFNVRSDALSVNKARAFGLGLGARLDF